MIFQQNHGKSVVQTLPPYTEGENNKNNQKNPRKGKDWESIMDKVTALANNHFACAKIATWRLLYHVKSALRSYLIQVPSLPADTRGGGLQHTTILSHILLLKIYVPCRQQHSAELSQVTREGAVQ